MFIDNTLTQKCCPFCGDISIESIGKISYEQPLVFSTIEVTLCKTPELWKCRKCKSGFTQYAIPEDVAKKLYTFGAGNERWCSDSFEEEKESGLIGVLEKYFTPNMSILDIGCNTGELLDFACSRGCQTSGVEFSSTSRKVVAEKGHMAYCALDDTVGCYDVITGFDLLEHVYDVPAFLSHCLERLKLGGHLIFLTGNFSCLSARLTGAKWWYIRFPEHIMFPSKNFYKSVPGFSVTQWFRTYASKKLVKPIGDRLYTLAKGIQHANYSAQPSLTPDHVLVVLKKCNPV